MSRGMLIAILVIYVASINGFLISVRFLPIEPRVTNIISIPGLHPSNLVKSVETIVVDALRIKEKITLFYKGRILDVNKRLKYYNIGDSSVLTAKPAN
ncbi:hypothetical protein GWI33_021609 [Rhynchophorus ferrugineus]|uniref:Ubiquitin-like domain-containing protein n=1 Tax=Rhynchophorus ferrugineus TaxID=354439 RepID=A0A834IP38_RHYFE|nr:hypothetical protein GWI33_021609 [Rhynchophorus ferrugineus]